MAIIVVVALVAAGVAFLLAGGDDDPDTAAGTEAGEGVVLEPLNSPGDSPFTTDLTVNEVAAQPDAIAAVAGVHDELDTDPATGTLTASGTTVGLYGGTTDDQACDPSQLADFLDANPEQARAWADAQQIDAVALDDFIASLTPVFLTTDTWVTNHGYRNGRATPHQAVLQAGTAVLVDDTGTPRVKCSCGNPLLGPDTGASLEVTTGTPWDGYAPGNTTIVQPGPQTDSLTLTDLESGNHIEQPIGTGTELVLAADGLGVVTFGQPREAVEATLTALLGPPTLVRECNYQANSLCTAHDPQGWFITWDGLTIYISRDSNQFEQYSRGAVAREDGEYDLTAGPEASTPEGVSVGSSVDDLFASYSGLQSYECDFSTYEAVLSPAVPGSDGSFRQGTGGYTFVVEDGLVIQIAEEMATQFRDLGCGP